MTARRAPGWWYPWIFVVGMVMVACVNGVLAFFAVSTWTGLETKNYYDRGLRYNRTIAAAKEQDARGWSMTFSSLPADMTNGGVLGVTFTDRFGGPIDDLAVEAILMRPTQEGLDAAFALHHQGGGVYAAEVSVPLPGQWDARILAHRKNENFQASRRLFVP
jgi:nitrogen fixation protein FixH